MRVLRRARASSTGIVPLPPNGCTGSPRGHVWVRGAVAAYRCEGLDPWATRATYARGHGDISAGGEYLRKLWRVEYERPTWYVTSRHCSACGRALEEGRAA